MRTYLSLWLLPWLLPMVVLLSARDVRAQAEESLATDAKLLAQTMQVAQSTKLGIEASVQKAVTEGHANQQELDCVKAARMDFAVDAYAASIATALSPDEIKRALVFFASKEGQGYLRYSRNQELQQRGIASADSKTDLTSAEYRAVTKFLDTTAGKKLLEARVLESRELKSSLAQNLMALVNRCKT